MSLPILITDKWLSYVEFDAEGAQIVSSGIFPIGFKSNPFNFSITSKELNTILSKEGREIKADVKNKRLISSANIADIEIDYKITDILDLSPFPIIIPELDYLDIVNGLGIDYQNICANYLHYKVDLPVELRVLLDSKSIINNIKSSPGDFVDSDYIVIATPGLTGIEKTTYIKNVIPIISEFLPVAGIWRIHFDSEMKVVPLVAALSENESNIHDYFENNPPEADANLIIAPGVKEIEIEGEDLSQKIELKVDSMNTIKLAEDKSINMKWKSKNSKFSGEIFGSKTGVKIDNRERGSND